MPRLLILVAVLALASPLMAQAKGLERVQICGERGCVEIADEHRLELLPFGVVAAPPAGEFYVLSFTVSGGGPDPEQFAMYYVASERLLGANGATTGSLTWLPPTEQAIEVLERATAAMEPFPRPSAWPAELKSPARVPLPSDAAPELHSGSGIAWPLVASSLVVALLLGLGSFAIMRRPPSPRANAA